MPTKPSKVLETFDNPNPERDYRIQITIPEFTCLCPKTGQPDFATLYLEYIADRKCVELKSLKQYVWSYRNEGAFHEAVTNIILNDLVAATGPRYMQLRAEFNVRGGIYTSVTVEHRQHGWREQMPPPQVEQPIESPAITPTKAPAPALTRAAPKPAPVESKVPVETKRTGTGTRFRMLPRTRETEIPEDAEPETVASPPPPPRTETKAPPAKAAPKPPAKQPIYIGVDVGSSGCMAVAVDAQGRVLQQVRTPMPLPTKREEQVTQDPQVWWQAVMQCLRGISKGIDGSRVAAISVDATSGTILLADSKGAPVTPALMYNDSRAHKEAARIAEVADRNSGAHGNSSALAKLLWLDARASEKKTRYCLHQSDWILGKLSGVFGVSDYNNTLKLGYDAERSKWPDWFTSLSINQSWLPRVVAPGTPLGNLRRELAQELGFSAEARVLAGTTDGVASFIAAGASEPGQAVTSLGSTLVLKLLSDRAVYSPEHGVYSHRLGNRWLVGGASNAGGAALLQYFKLEQIEEMTPLLEPDTPTGLEYYPLAGIGERFPIYDPEMAPVLEPLPGDSVTFFQGMLEGIARIEAQGYKLLTKLGAPSLKQVFTTGGGSENPAWQRIRERVLGVTMTPPRSRIAAYGTALLAAGATSITTETTEKITVA